MPVVSSRLALIQAIKLYVLIDIMAHAPNTYACMSHPYTSLIALPVSDTPIDTIAQIEYLYLLKSTYMQCR